MHGKLMNDQVLTYYAWMHYVVYLRLGYINGYAEQERVKYLKQLRARPNVERL